MKVSIAIAVLLALIYFARFYKPYSLDKVLDHYGFTTSQQKRALHDLYQKATGMPWQEAFSSRHTKKALMRDILTFIEKTQEKFIVRKGLQERWEVEALPWMTQNKGEILDDLRTLGFIEEIEPTHKHVDAICILGATWKTMLRQFQYTHCLLKSGVTAPSLIFLGGERYVTVGVDGTEEELSALAAKLGVSDWRQLTEAHLMTELYTTSKIKNQKITPYFINTPKGDLPRPTTQTTMMELITWLKHHPEIKSLLFVSPQPHVKYQEAIIQSIFADQHKALSFHVVGPGVTNSQNMKPLIEGLGSYLWATTPPLLAQLGLEERDPHIIAELKELYNKNPLMYKELPAILRTP